MTEVQIDYLGQRGEGVAEVAGGRVFVPFTLPGETAEISVTGDRGTVQTLIAPSPERIDPFCPHFTLCGGCALQHVGPVPYAAFKQNLVATALAHVGITTDVGALIDARGTGRRRTTVHARKSGAGFMAHRSHDLRDIDRCPILVPALNPATDIARAAFAAIGDCDVSLTASEIGLDVNIRPEKRADPRRLLALGKRFGLARLCLDGEMIWQSRVPVIAIGKAIVELPPQSFLQATAAAETVMAELVGVALAKSKHIADLFCGLGPFALRLAETARITAADSDKAAILSLQKAVRNTQGLKPVTASARDLFRNPFAPAELGGIDGVVFDPPRAGAEQQVRELARTTIRTIVAVSCDPVSFARDARILIDGGYRLKSVTPLDQFAYAAHVEIVGVFRR